MSLDKKLNYAVYIRESTREQAINGYNIDDQLKKTQNYIELYDPNFSSVSIYEDGGYSASSIHRPQLKKLLNDIKNKKVDVIVIHNLDRLTRKLKDLIFLLEFFNKNSVSLISITERLDTTSPAGKFFTYLICLIAQWELETIGERTNRGIIEAANQGKYILGGKAPFGLLRDKTRLYKDPIKFQIIEDIFLLVSKHSISETCRIINEKYKLNLTNKKLIYHVKNKIYLGIMKLKGKEYRVMDPVIDPEIWENAQKHFFSKKTTHHYIFKGKIFTTDNIPFLNSCGKPRKTTYLYYIHPEDLSIRFSEHDVLKYVIPKLSSKISKQELLIALNKNKNEIINNQLLQKEILHSNIPAKKAKELLSELIKKELLLENLVSSLKCKSYINFLFALPKKELSKIVNNHISRIIVDKYKNIMIEYK